MILAIVILLVELVALCGLLGWLFTRRQT